MSCWRTCWSFLEPTPVSKAAVRHKSGKRCAVPFVTDEAEGCDKDARQMNARKNNRLPDRGERIMGCLPPTVCAKRPCLKPKFSWGSVKSVTYAPYGADLDGGPARRWAAALLTRVVGEEQDRATPMTLAEKFRRAKGEDGIAGL